MLRLHPSGVVRVLTLLWEAFRAPWIWLTGTRPREEVFENTSFEFVWALRQSQGFYHIYF